MFIVVFVCVTHEESEGDSHVWAPEQRGKDLNVSGWSYDKHTEVRDRARIAGAGRSTFIMCTVHESDTDKVTSKVRGQGPSVMYPTHCMHAPAQCYLPGAGSLTCLSLAYIYSQTP